MNPHDQMTPEAKPQAKPESSGIDRMGPIEGNQMSPSALDVYGKLLLAVAIPLAGFFFLGMTGFVPLLFISEGKPGGLVFIGACATIGAGICWIGRHSGVMLLIGLLLIGFAVFCGDLWLDAAL